MFDTAHRCILYVAAIAASLASTLLIANLAGTARPPDPPAARPVAAPTPAGMLIDHPCTNCALSVAATDEAVWVGTVNAGVVRWDRATGAMQRFTHADGLGGDAIWRMAAEPGGRVWAAVRERTIFSPYEGLSLYDGVRWTHIPTATMPITTNPISMVADPTAGVWLSDGTTTARFDGTVWLVPTAADGAPRGGHLAADTSGNVWLASGQDLYERIGGTWEAWRSFAGAIPDGSATALAVAADGTPYVGLAKVGTYDSLGVAHFDGASWHLFTTVDGLAPDRIGALAVDGSGTVWAAHVSQSNGLRAFDGARWRVQSTLDTPGLPGDQARALSVAPDGVLVLASTDGGAGIADANGWRTLRDPASHMAMAPFALDEAPDGALWAGFAISSGAHAIQRRHDGRWESWTLADGIPPLGVLAANQAALHFAADGTPFLGTFQDGVLTREGGRWHTITVRDGLPSDEVRDVLVAPDGRLWVATKSGLARRDGGGWTVFTTADGLPSAEVRTLAASADGTVWAGTPSGAAAFDGRRWTTLTTADGLPDDYVRAIAVGSDGAVWFGTHGGLARRDGTGWRTWTRADGLPGDGIAAIDVDAAGRAWAVLTTPSDGTAIGLLAVDDVGWSLLDNVGGRFFDPYTSLYDILVTRDGHIWLASLFGLQEFVPEPIVLPPTPQPTPAPLVPSCTCGAARRALPAAVLADALANPASYAGWGERVNPNLPPGPANPVRTCLDIRDPGTPFHPLFNGPIWRGGCR